MIRHEFGFAAVGSQRRYQRDVQHWADAIWDAIWNETRLRGSTSLLVPSLVRRILTNGYMSAGLLVEP